MKNLFHASKNYPAKTIIGKKGITRNWEKHQFHLVATSQLPILMALSTMLVVLSLVFYWHPSEIKSVVWLDFMTMHIAFIMFTLTLLSWFIMVVRESQAGYHTAIVQQGLRLGVVLFIVSEIMFFFAFFWAYFHYSLSPSVFIGYAWPPMGIQPLDPWGLPLTNTLLLLSSGVTITFAHRAIVNAQTTYHQLAFMKHLVSTIILGVTFLVCQGIEYKYGITFSWKENVYGSIFFTLTGFHGFHVTFGTMFLWFCLVRAILSRGEIIFTPVYKLYNYIDTKYTYLYNRIIIISWICRAKASKIFKIIHDSLKANKFAKKFHDMFAPKKKKPKKNRVWHACTCRH